VNGRKTHARPHHLSSRLTNVAVAGRDSSELRRTRKKATRFQRITTKVARHQGVRELRGSGSAPAPCTCVFNGLRRVAPLAWRTIVHPGVHRAVDFDCNRAASLKSKWPFFVS
jgi:hypothetical protein